MFGAADLVYNRLAASQQANSVAPAPDEYFTIWVLQNVDDGLFLFSLEMLVDLFVKRSIGLVR